jgi:hypothetical protein
MNIKKIKLQDGGLRGLVITGERVDMKEGRSSITPCEEEPKFPIHLGLERRFRDLIPYLLELSGHLPNGVGEDDRDFIIQDTELVSLKIGDDSFLLSGKRRMTESGKKIAINSYLVESGDDYLNFDKVMVIVKEIIDETLEYMRGNRAISEREMGERILESLIKKGKKTADDLAEFQDMSDDEKKAFCTKWLEDTGSIVTHVEDFEISNDTPILKIG